MLFSSITGGFSNRFWRLAAWIFDKRGNVAAITALLLVPLIGAMSLGTEASSWFLIRRAMQNTADSAVLAAAANGDTSQTQPCTEPCTEAKSVATQYGFTNGANNTIVTALNNVTCPGSPSGATNCYQVTITKNVPLYLTEVVGYTGTGGSGTQTITATAIASPPVPREFCDLSLASGTDITISGNDLVCYLKSNDSVRCNGLASELVVYVNDNKGCDNVSQARALPDPYASLAVGNIPANPCTPVNSKNSYPQEPSLPAGNQLSGALTWPATKIFCGDVQLTNNVNLTTASPGTVLVIENGQLDLNGYKLKTLNGSGLTIIFTGPKINGFSPTQYPTDNVPTPGTLDMVAPTTGHWSGVAIYQYLADQTYGSESITYRGGSNNYATWDITGLVYLPTARLNFWGTVGKSSNGVSCFSIVDSTIDVNGTGAIYNNSQSQCTQAGLVPPTDPTGRQALVE